MSANTEKQKVMNEFEKAIKAYLDARAEKDELFAKKYQESGKSIGGCCNYIISEVKKRSKGKDTALDNDEVYGLAVHFFDEDNIKEEKGMVKCHVVVSRQLNEEEKAKARKEAQRRFEEERKAAEKKAMADEVQAQLEKLRREERVKKAIADAPKAVPVKAARRKPEKIDMTVEQPLLFSFEEDEDETEE